MANSWIYTEEHSRLMAEKDAEIERLLKEHDHLSRVAEDAAKKANGCEREYFRLRAEIERLRAGLVVLTNAADKAVYYRDCPDSLPQTVALAKVILEAAEAAKEAKP